MFKKRFYRLMNAGVLCTTEFSLVESKEIEGSESENAKIACESNVN
jgi:hypothetical protein